MKQRVFKKLPLLLILAFLAAMPAVALADPAPGCDAGGDKGGLWGVMQRRAEVQRVRDRMYSHIIKQNDSALAMTCFDRALALSSRIGAIFSDAPPESPLPAPVAALFGEGDTAGKLYNTFGGFGLVGKDLAQQRIDDYNKSKSTADQVFDALFPKGKGPKKTTSNSLAGAYKDVVGDQLQAYMTAPGAFTASISGQLGATVSNALQSLVGKIDGFLSGSIKGMLDKYTNIDLPSSLSANISINIGGVFTLNADFTASILGPVAVVIDGLQNIMGTVGAVMKAKDDALGALNDAGGVIDTFTSGMSDLMNAANFLGSAETSLAGLDWAALANGAVPGANTGCGFSAKTWAGGVSAAGKAVAGITGSGPTPDMPFFSTADLVAGTIDGKHPEIDAEASSDYNDYALAAGWLDMSVDLSSPQGSGITSWVPVQEVPAGISAGNVLSMMP